MQKVKVVPGLLLLACSLLLVGGISAAASPVIERYVVGSAGEPVTDGSLYILNSTLGEPIVSNIAVETNYGLGSGYWTGGIIHREPGANNTVYLPIVLENVFVPITLSIRNETGGTLNYSVYDGNPAAGGTLLCQVTIPPDAGLCGTFPAGPQWVSTSSTGSGCGSFDGSFVFPSGICTRVIRCGSPSIWEGLNCNN